MTEKYFLISEAKYNSMCNSENSEYSKQRADLYLNSFSPDVLGKNSLYNTALRNYVKKRREKDDDKTLSKNVNLQMSNIPSTPVKSESPINDGQDIFSLTQVTPELKVTSRSPKSTSKRNTNSQKSTPKSATVTAIASTPTPKRNTPTTIERTPRKRVKKTHDAAIEHITKHVKNNPGVYPVDSQDNILDTNNLPIPNSSIEKSVARYLDQAPGEYTPPGTKRIRSILNADPQVISVKRNPFKPDEWK